MAKHRPHRPAHAGHGARLALVPAADPVGSRKQLLEAGIRLFAKHGLDGTTVRDIAHEAGVNISLISYHFGGKEGLYRACLEDYGRDRLERTRGLLGPARTADELKLRLRLYVESLAASMTERPEFSRIICKEIEAGLPVASDIFEDTFLRVMNEVIQFFRAGQKSGLVREECDPLFLAHIVYGTLGHIARCDTVSKRYFNCSTTDPRTRQKLVDTLIDALTRGLLKC